MSLINRSDLLRDQVEFPLNLAPVGSFPEKFAASIAAPEFVEPQVGPRWNGLFVMFFIHHEKVTAAFRATGGAPLKVKLGEDSGELFGNVQGRGEPKGTKVGVAQDASFHHAAVGGENDRIDGGRAP